MEHLAIPPPIQVLAISGFMAGFLIASEALASCPPHDARARLLRSQPEQLFSCADDAAPEARSWAAQALAARSRWTEAAELAVAVAPALPEVAPFLQIASARWLLAAGRPAREAASRMPAEAEVPDRQWARADYHLLSGRLAASRGAWREALALARRAEQEAPLRDATGALWFEAVLKAGSPAEIDAALRTIRVERPGTALAAEAESKLGAKFPLKTLGAPGLARRWERWVQRAGAEKVAAECLPLLTELQAKTHDQARARLACGRALSTCRKPEASSVLAQAAQDNTVNPEATLAVARITARAGEPADVEQVCAGIVDSPASRDERAECAYLHAIMRLNRADRAAARAGLASVVERFPGHPRAKDAALFLAFDDLRNDRAAAFARFDAIATSGRDPAGRVQALYWRGRTRPLEDSAGARQDWARVLAMDPLGYYGWLAWERLGRPAEATGWRAPAARKARLPAQASLAAALLRTGMLPEAAMELDAAGSARAADMDGWLPLLREAERFDLVMKLGLTKGGGWGAWPPSGERAVAVTAAFPKAFESTLQAEADRADPYLMMSLMRRESAFQAEAKSAAQARGLLQLLPKTANALATDLGEPVPSETALHDPPLNVHLAAAYVQRLRQRFPNVLAIAASYNAGPTSVAGWIGSAPGQELDEWVERIPFRETRAYVKAVGGAYAAYQLIYEGKRPGLPLGPMPVAAPGIDY